MRALTSIAVAFLLAGIAQPTPHASQQRSSSVGDLLSRYERGDWEAVWQTPLKFSVVQDELNRLAPGFLASPEVGPHRARQVLAAFALEVAVQAFLAADMASAHKLVEWGWTTLRRLRTPSVADEFDRRWSLASVALLEATIDPAFLERHVSHIVSWFPAEDRLRLAPAIAAEQLTAPMTAIKGVAGPVTVVGAGNVGRAKADQERRIDRAIGMFRGLLDHEGLAGEARVRLAHLSLDRGDPTSALTWLENAERQTQDPQLIYLARLFRGQAFERLNQPEPALLAYRGALEVGPGAHAATISLAALLYTQGDRATADLLVGELLSRSERRADPWWTYWMGDWRFFDRTLVAVREALK